MSWCVGDNVVYGLLIRHWSSRTRSNIYYLKSVVVPFFFFFFFFFFARKGSPFSKIDRGSLHFLLQSLLISK